MPSEGMLPFEGRDLSSRLHPHPHKKCTGSLPTLPGIDLAKGETPI